MTAIAKPGSYRFMRSVRLYISRVRNMCREVKPYLGGVALTVPLDVCALENDDFTNIYCEQMNKDLGDLKGEKFELVLWVKEENKMHIEVKGLIRLLSSNGIPDYFVKEESKVGTKVIVSYKDPTAKRRAWKTIEIEATDLKICHSSGNRDNYLGQVTVSAWRPNGSYQIKFQDVILNLEVLMCMEAGNLVKPMTENLMKFKVELEEDPLNYDLVLIAQDGFEVECHSVYVARHNAILELMCKGASHLNPLKVQMHMSKDCLRAFVNYLYEFDSVHLIYVWHNENIGKELIKVADNYDIPELSVLVQKLKWAEDISKGCPIISGDMEENESFQEQDEKLAEEKPGSSSSSKVCTLKCKAEKRLEIMSTARSAVTTDACMANLVKLTVSLDLDHGMISLIQ